MQPYVCGHFFPKQQVPGYESWFLFRENLLHTIHSNHFLPVYRIPLPSTTRKRYNILLFFSFFQIMINFSFRLFSVKSADRFRYTAGPCRNYMPQKPLSFPFFYHSVHNHNRSEPQKPVLSGVHQKFHRIVPSPIFRSTATILHADECSSNPPGPYRFPQLHIRFRPV